VVRRLRRGLAIQGDCNGSQKWIVKKSPGWLATFLVKYALW
jgi:hypothetical protein